MQSLIASENVLAKIAANSRLKQAALSSEKLGLRAMLVGGAVRDLFLGRETFDIDIVVEYETEKLARQLQHELSSELLLHPAFGTRPMDETTKRTEAPEKHAQGRRVIEARRRRGFDL